MYSKHIAIKEYSNIDDWVNKINQYIKKEFSEKYYRKEAIPKPITKDMILEAIDKKLISFNIITTSRQKKT